MSVFDEPPLRTKERLPASQDHLISRGVSTVSQVLVGHIATLSFRFDWNFVYKALQAYRS